MDHLGHFYAFSLLWRVFLTYTVKPGPFWCMVDGTQGLNSFGVDEILSASRPPCRQSTSLCPYAAILPWSDGLPHALAQCPSSSSILGFAEFSGPGSSPWSGRFVGTVLWGPVSCAAHVVAYIVCVMLLCFPPGLRAGPREPCTAALLKFHNHCECLCFSVLRLVKLGCARGYARLDYGLWVVK